MNNIFKSSLIIVAAVFMLTACNNNKNSQATQNTSPAQSNAPKVDTIAKSNAAAATALVKDGMNTINYPNGGVKMEGLSKDGKRSGEWKSYFPDGKLQSDESFTDGQPEGKVTVYYQNGQKMYEGENHSGTLSGVWHYWNEKGELTSTKDYTKNPIKHQ